MFNNSKYTLWYYNIINRTSSRKRNKDYESHHIIPKSIGGNNDTKNLVNLTRKEHYICHRLLVKMTAGSDCAKMHFALWCMINGNGRKPRFIPCSTVYETVRKKSMKVKSESQKGEKNHFYGKKHSAESRKRMSDNNPAKRPEVREKMRGTRPGVKPHNYYTGWSDKVKSKISNSLKGFVHTDATREKMKASKTNIVWVFKDNTKPKQINVSELDKFLSDNWKRGRGPRKDW